MKNEKYNVGVINTIKQEAGVQDMWDVDYTKLSPDSRTRFDKLVQEDRKYIKAEELEGLASFEAAANKLNVEDLAKTTGIADAAFNSVLDRLGLDLPDETLVQSANYNIIKNTIIKAAMGSQVTGNELERMKAQLGTEFRADKTVRVKMAETLDNLVAKYDSYKVSAPHIYARLMKDKVNNMKEISNYLRNPDAKPKVEGATEPTQPTQTGGQGTKVKVGQIVNGYQYIGGEANNPKSWKKVGQ